MKKRNKSMRAQGLHYSKSRVKSHEHEAPKERSTRENINSLIKNVTGDTKPSKANLSHRAFEIIPRHSPYGHHFRSLLNAENFVANKEFQMALDVYQRMLNKIPLRSISEKIEDNIDDIESFLEADESAPPNRISLDVNLSGSLMPQQPPTGQFAVPPQGQQTGQQSGAGAPIEIKINPDQQGVPGNQPMFYPVVLPPGAFPGMENQPPDIEKKGPKPFGFFQQQTANIDTNAPLPSQESTAKQEEDFGFLSSATGVPQSGAKVHSTDEMEHPAMKRTNNLLEGISEGIMQVEKAIFKAKTMDVEAEQVNAKEEPGQPKPQEEEQVKEQTEEPVEESEEELKEKPKEEAESEEPEMKERTMPPREEEESEGVLDSGAGIPSLDEESLEDEGESEEKEEESQIQEIRGVLELKEPEQEDTPFITITYDFSKIPHHFYLSKDHNILEYAYYKYKPMLVKAQKFIQKKQITKALNYYRVIRDQQIPAPLKFMIDKNINDISEYLEKYLMMRPG